MNYMQKILQKINDTLQMISGVTKSAAGDPNAWEPTIRGFEEQDRRNPPPKGAIVFTGSSSITFWDTLPQDMAPLPVINRGFGGSRIGEVARYASRIVIPYQPRAVVLFAGTNDIADPRPATAQEVFARFQEFVRIVQAALPQTPIYYISITPTPSRWKYWPIAAEANRLIQDFTGQDPRLRYIDLTAGILKADGKPDRGLYRLDRLHPNKKGYAQWTGVIKPILTDGLCGAMTDDLCGANDRHTASARP